MKLLQKLKDVFDRKAEDPLVATARVLQKWKCRYIVADDGIVVPDDLYICGNVRGTLPDLSRVAVQGSVYADDSGLTSLKGAPFYVGKHFFCDGNELTSLEGAPQHVGEQFGCDRNKLANLDFAPKEFGLLISDFGTFASPQDMEDGIKALRAAVREQMAKDATVLRRSISPMKKLSLKMRQFTTGFASA